MTEKQWPPPGAAADGMPAPDPAPPPSDHPPSSPDRSSPSGPINGDVAASWAPAPAEPSVAGPGGADYPPPGHGGTDYPPPVYGGQVPGVPPPGVGYEPATVPTRKSNWWKWLLGTVLVLAVLIGGCAVVLFRAVQGPLDATNEFFAAVNGGDLSRAASLVSTDPECGFSGDPEDAVDRQFTGITVEDYFFAGATVAGGDDVSRAEVIGVVTTVESGQVNYAVTMVEEADEWKVCSLEQIQ